MVSFSVRELAFINAHEICHLATCSKEGGPHVVPVAYLFIDGTFCVATDYETQKYRNVQRDDRVALVIDTSQPNRAIVVRGRAEAVERGADFRHLYAIFHKRFGWVRADPWTEGEAPFLKIKPDKKTSWGLRT